jgi:hypothetical protein
MSKRIVIIPTFASSHLLKCWLPNMIEVIEPDIIIINEGIFPTGPENKGHIDEKFKEKYCFEDTNAGFDYYEMVELVGSFEFKHPDITFLVGPFEYQSSDANQCFLEAISYSYPIEFEVGTLIFPLEPDAFVHELDQQTINEEIRKLSPGQGISCQWVDFLETQFYTENINISQPKYRRFAYCFDNMENYKAAMSGFMSQDYPKLTKVNSFFVYHYPWFVFDKWKELRYDLIYRSNPQYWKDFEVGLQEIRNFSKMWVDYNTPNPDGTINMNKMVPLNKITIRPSRNDEARYAKFIDISHPSHIRNHPNFVK